MKPYQWECRQFYSRAARGRSRIIQPQQRSWQIPTEGSKDRIRLPQEAAKGGHEDIVALLLDRGADVHVTLDGDGDAIIAAARCGRVEIARMILDAGADVNAGVDGDGNALIMAVTHDHRELIEFLLSRGADPEAHVDGDDTALQRAVEDGNTEVLRLLLDHVEDR